MNEIIIDRIAKVIAKITIYTILGTPILCYIMLVVVSIMEANGF